MNAFLQQLEDGTRLDERGHSLFVTEDGEVAFVAYDDRTESLLIVETSPNKAPHAYVRTGYEPRGSLVAHLSISYAGWIVVKNNLGLPEDEGIVGGL